MSGGWTLFGGPLPRRCGSCREVKPVEAFKIDRSRPDGHGYICRACERLTPAGVPTPRERQEERKLGVAWCRNCAAWLPVSEMTKQGVCREHQRQADRALYAANAEHRERRKAHSTRRKRGVDPVPLIARELILELFEGGCAYCEQPAETWDHVVPVSRGGKTEPANILPACIACNSSKRDRGLDEWLTATGRTMSVRAVEHLAHHGGLDG